MPQEGNGSLRPRLSAAQRDPSDHAEASAWINEPPSSNLSNDEWRRIADSLGLSVRQLQIVRGVFDGLDEPSIAHQLGVSSHTIHAHLNRLYRKIRVKSRCDLIVRVFLAYVAPESRARICPIANQPSRAPASRPSRSSHEQLSAAGK